jgi:ribonucleoside-diphosphate reductase alpha chain
MQQIYSDKTAGVAAGAASAIKIFKRDGLIQALHVEKIVRTLQRHMQEAEQLPLEVVVQETIRLIFEGATTQDIEKALIVACTTFIEKDPAYGKLASRLFRQRLCREVTQKKCLDAAQRADLYRHFFVVGIKNAVAAHLLDERLLTFDLEWLAQRLVIERDEKINYTGMQTLYERYLLKIEERRIETVQAFWMRIAMGLALEEEHKNERALEFYELISQLLYIPSTPTLFHAGLPVAQLSSCYLTTIQDDLSHIFKCFSDNAQLAKWAGGIATDFTNIRATGSYIKGIKAFSQGIVPYLKIANDIVVCITRTGIRRGGTCAYLEAWHLDFEDFLDLRRNTGDERRRTHDMNTAAWVPDLLMQRVKSDGHWTFFSPDETPDLHDLYGAAFVTRYQHYEQMADEGKIKNWQRVSALALWRKMLTRLFETGHPWITFKDACNVRSPQDHVGVVHSSNLCTEITLNTSADETAVCNLGSINLKEMTANGTLDEELLKKTVTTAVRMLDNVIDLNYYPTVEGKNANLKHRPIGLGIMGFQDALFNQRIPFSEDAALRFADESMEKISYYAISASVDLAAEKGAYPTFKGSKWDRGIFPLDTIALLEQERGESIAVNRETRMPWEALKARMKQYGIRNSNVHAIAPTATISTIAGTYPCIEPIFKNIYVKSNVSGEFTVVNEYLVDDLKKRGMWHDAMLDAIKYCDGDLSLLPALPDDLKKLYQTAFELDPLWLVQISAARMKWLDQSQSHNVFIKGVSGPLLHKIYMTAWEHGMKTTYYLRVLGASQVEKATLDASVYGFTQKRSYNAMQTSSVNADLASSPASCSMVGSSDCESCQ